MISISFTFILILLAAVFMFLLFTAGQLIGFVTRVLLWTVWGLRRLIAMFRAGTHGVIKGLLVLLIAVIVMSSSLFAFFLLLLLAALCVGLLKLVIGNDDGSPAEQCDDPVLRRARAAMRRMDRRLKNLETILGERL